MNWFDNYRQQNQHLFGEDSDFSDTEEDFEPEENEEIEIEESQETEDYEALKSSLNFTPIHNEEPQRGRPASTSNSRTQILEISENTYENPLDLFNVMYGNKLISEIVTGTNEKIVKMNRTDSCYYPVTESKIEELFGLLIIMNAYKSENEHMRDFLVRLRTYPESFGFQGYKIMTRNEFEFYYSHLDIGTSPKVPNESDPLGRPIYDLRAKLQPIIDHFNSSNLKLKNPNPDSPLAIDETLRSSYSRSNILRQFMPNKPAKYGEKSFALADSDLFIHRLLFQFPRQFSETDGTLRDLMSKMVPKEFHGQNLTILCDNYFLTMDVLLDFQKKNIALLGTMRSNRVKRHFSGQIFDKLTKIPKKSTFERNIRTYKTTTFPNKSLNVYFYTDKPSKKPVILTTNDPESIRRCPENDSKPVSRTLEAKEIPVPVKRYNKYMGAVDVIDRILKKYSTAQKVGHRADKTAYFKKTACYMFDVFFLNVFAFYRSHYYVKNPLARNLPRNYHRDFLLDIAKKFLKKEEVQIELPYIHNPLLGIDLNKENHKITPSRRVVCEICENGKKNRTRIKCSRCKKYICSAHSEKLTHIVCVKCKK